MTRTKLHLSREDAAVVTQVTAAISDQARGQTSFDRLLNIWINLIGRVERGYDDTIYDYTNDASVRDLIERVAAALSTDGQTVLGAYLRAWDDRFLAATAPPQGGSTSWADRMPLLLVGDMIEDVASLRGGSS